MKDATFLIHGRLGGDVEFRENNGKRMAIINVATEERYIKDNEEVRKTHWLRLVCFKPNLMNYLSHFRKGMIADFEGSIKTSEWTDNNNVKQYSMNLDVDDCRLVGHTERRDNQQDHNQGHDQQGYNDNQGYSQNQATPHNNGQNNNQAAPPPQGRQNPPQGNNQGWNGNRPNSGQGQQNNPNNSAHAQAGNGYGDHRG